MMEKFDVGLSRKDVVHVLAVFAFAGLITVFIGNIYQQEDYSVDIDRELNSSNEVITVEFYNESVDFIRQIRGVDVSYHLDANRDGEPERRLDTVNDGNVHQEVMLLDYPDNIYQVYYRYMIDPDGGDWMQVYRVEALKEIH